MVDFYETKWFKEELTKANARSKRENSILDILTYAEAIFFFKDILYTTLLCKPSYLGSYHSLHYATI